MQKNIFDSKDRRVSEERVLHYTGSHHIIGGSSGKKPFSGQKAVLPSPGTSPRLKKRENVPNGSSTKSKKQRRVASTKHSKVIKNSSRNKKRVESIRAINRSEKKKKHLIMTGLKEHQQDALEVVRDGFRKDNAEEANLRAINQELKDTLSIMYENKGKIKGGTDYAKKNKVTLPTNAEGLFMSRRAYRGLLGNLCETDHGAPHKGQHVFHIISSANGGPDHADNYLYALGGSFNIAVGATMDHFNCYLAGKNASKKAVSIAKKVAANPELHKHITTNKKNKILYTTGRHQGMDAEGLYEKGEKLLRLLRRENR